MMRWQSLHQSGRLGRWATDYGPIASIVKSANLVRTTARVERRGYFGKPWSALGLYVIFGWTRQPVTTRGCPQSTRPRCLVRGVRSFRLDGDHDESGLTTDRCMDSGHGQVQLVQFVLGG